MDDVKPFAKAMTVVDGHEYPAIIAKSEWVIYDLDTYDKDELFSRLF